MSDPVTKAEIEDVLSSIRRLVSGDARAQLHCAGAAPAAGIAPACGTPTPDRLVLTPALRVGEITPPPAYPGEYTTDGASPDDDPNEPWRDGDATLFATARNASAPVSAPEDDAPATEASAGEGTDTARVESLSAKIQALELAIGRTRDRWEPDGCGGDDDYAGTTVKTIEWEDHSDAPDEDDAGPIPVRPRARAEIDDRADFDRPDFAAEDDSFLDENSLRELVADIVRQELMGALGERITRNVRKLVRREIHRALSAQDLD